MLYQISQAVDIFLCVSRVEPIGGAPFVFVSGDVFSGFILFVRRFGFCKDLVDGRLATVLVLLGGDF